MAFLKASTKSQYALRVLVYIAQNEGRVVPLSEISKKEKISYGYLEEIVSPLLKKGFLSSVSGRKGGYFLKKDARKIRVFDVVSIFEGDLAPVKCLSGKSCEHFKRCKTKNIWTDLHDVVLEKLKSKSLNDLIYETR